MKLFTIPYIFSVLPVVKLEGRWGSGSYTNKNGSCLKCTAIKSKLFSSVEFDNYRKITESHRFSSPTYLARENLFGQWTQVADNNLCFEGRRENCLSDRRTIVVGFRYSRADVCFRHRARDAGLLRNWHSSWWQRVSPTHVYCKNSNQNYELQLASHGLSRQRSYALE